MDYVAILNAYADKIGVTTVLVVVVTLVITYSLTTKNDDKTAPIAVTSPVAEQATVEQAPAVQSTKQGIDAPEPVKEAPEPVKEAPTPAVEKPITESAPVRDFDTFINCLCTDGITVKLIKAESSEKDKIIKLSCDGELYWSARLSAAVKKIRLSLTGKKDVIDTVNEIEKVFISPETDTVVIIQSKNAERSIKFSCKDQEEAKYYTDSLCELVNRVKADPNCCSTFVTVKTPVQPKQEAEQQSPGTTEAEVPVSKELFVDETKDSN